MKARIVALLAIITAALGLTSGAQAAPVYLACVFGNPDYPIEITVDEAESMATVHLPHSGYTKQSRAAFTADQVMFEDDVEPYVLNRTDLRIVRGRSGSRRIMEGRCRIVTAPQRAF